MNLRVLWALAAAALGACGGEHARDWGRADTAAMMMDTPGAVQAAERVDPAEPDDPDRLDDPPGELVLAADSASGDAIFHRNGRCFTCHGSAGEGMPRLGPSLRDGVWLHSDGSLAGIRQSIANGVATPRVSPIAMPAFSSQLTGEELRQLSGYVYTLSRPASVLEDAGDPSGPVAAPP